MSFRVGVAMKCVMTDAQNTDSQVLTLIAALTASTLTPQIAEAAGEALARAGATVESPDWLAEGVACDIGYSGLDPRTAEAAVEPLLRAVSVDAAAQARHGRRKKALVADMDSTIVTSETLDELAAAAGLKDKIAAITARAMNGELDFADSLRERVAMLEGLAEVALAETLAQVELTPGAQTLVATMRAHDCGAALVSGGFMAIAEPVGARCGFERVVANRLEIVGGVLTGRVIEPIVGREAKVETLEKIALDKGIALADVCAVGDGANDLPMLLAAGLGVAFHAKPTVRVAARVKVNHGDLTALLYLQGYRREEFVS